MNLIESTYSEYIHNVAVQHALPEEAERALQEGFKTYCESIINKDNVLLEDGYFSRYANSVRDDIRNNGSTGLHYEPISDEHSGDISEIFYDAHGHEYGIAPDIDIIKTSDNTVAINGLEFMCQDLVNPRTRKNKCTWSEAMQIADGYSKDGWRLPTMKDWQRVIRFVEGTRFSRTVQGIKDRFANDKAHDEAYYRHRRAYYVLHALKIKSNAMYWTSTEIAEDLAAALWFCCTGRIGFKNAFKSWEESVRLVRDI